MMNITENKIFENDIQSKYSITSLEDKNRNLYNEFQDLSVCGKNIQSSELNDNNPIDYNNSKDVEINANALFDNLNILTDTNGTCKDISNQNQPLFLNDKQQINILLISIKDLILVTDDEGVILDCNVSENNLSLITPGLFKNKSISDLFHDCIANEFINKIKFALNNKELITYQYHIESGSLIRYFEAILSQFSDNKVVVSIRGIDNPYDSDDKLKNIISLQSLINGISSDIIQSQLSNFDRIIKLSLTQLGIFTQVDRISIFKIKNDRNVFENFYEWCVVDIAQDTDNPEVNSNDIFQKWMENFEENKHIYIPSVDIRPSENSNENSIQILNGVKSLLAVPMNYNGVLFGLINFYSIKSHKFWDEETISLLKVVGEIFAGSIQKNEFELELIKQKQQAELVNTAKSEFVANVCRELMLPMHSILNLSEILVTSNLYNDNLKQSSLIYKNSKRLVKILNDISKMSKIDSGKYEINEEPVFVKALLSEIQQVFSVKLAEKKLKFNIEVHDGFPDKIIFDDAILRTILYNLVSNAIKFTDRGRVDIIADITYGLGNSIVDIRFTIIDTGIGFEQEHKNFIFEPFRRIDNEINRHHKGLGLGLTTTKSLVDLLGGSICAESSLGSGSTFSVEFKKIKVVKENLDTKEYEYNNYLYEFDHSRILVVDETKQSRELIKSFLSDFNFSVYMAENEQEIVEYVNHIKYDLILLNFKSNSKNYYEIIKSIKNINLKDIPVVAISPAHNISDKQQNINSFAGYINKPFSKNELLQCLSNHLPHNKILIKTELNDNDVNVLVAKQLVDSIDNQILAKFIQEFELLHKENIQEIVEYFDEGTINKIILDFNNFAGNHGIEAFSNLSQQIINATESLDYDSINDSANTIMKSIAYCKQIM